MNASIRNPRPLVTTITALEYGASAFSFNGSTSTVRSSVSTRLNMSTRVFRTKFLGRLTVTGSKPAVNSASKARCPYQLGSTLAAHLSLGSMSIVSPREIAAYLMLSLASAVTSCPLDSDGLLRYWCPRCPSRELQSLSTPGLQESRIKCNRCHVPRLMHSTFLRLTDPVRSTGR